eukprot:Hpha_TRINITY_DN6108_c0_g1::TRINITY_DN6108_c0_g1_i1::g.164885::m.164885
MAAGLKEVIGADVEYVKRHRLDKLLDGMVMHLINTKPDRPIPALRAYVLRDCVEHAATAAACIASVAVVGQPLVSPVPNTCVMTPDNPFAAWIGKSPADMQLPHGGSVVVVGGTSLIGSSAAHVIGGPRAHGAAHAAAHSGVTPPKSRRQSSRWHTQQGGGDDPRPAGRTTSRPTLGAPDDSELDPICPPPGLFGDDGATLRRRSQAMHLVGVQGARAGNSPGMTAVTPSVSAISQAAVSRTSSGTNQQDAAIVRRKVEVVTSPANSNQATPEREEPQEMRLMTSQMGMTSEAIIACPTSPHSEAVDSGSDLSEPQVTGGEAKPKKEKVGFGGGQKKDKTPLGKSPFGPPPDEDGLQIALNEIKQCAEEDEIDMLDLHGLTLKAIPESLCELGGKLISLDLSNNEISEVPPEIVQLPFLTSLSLKSNQLKSLPDEIGELSELTDLHLGHNMLEVLPDTFHQLQCLRVCGLDWNDFVGFPEQLFKIRSLELLYIVENPGVTALPTREQMEESWDQIEIHIDNSPELVKQWKQDILKEGEKTHPTVKIDWNSVFPDLICDTIYLGSLRSAQQVRIYEHLNITHLASIGRELTVVLAPGMEQLQLNVDDMPGVDLTPHFDAAHEFMDQAIDKKVGVLVHCFKGQSRSATVVVTYLMKKRRITRDAAIAEVKRCRPCINPNPGFMDVMARYEKALGIT